MTDEQNTNEQPVEQAQPEQQGPLIWDMPKLRRWVEAGMAVDSEDVIDGYTLRRIAEDGLVLLAMDKGDPLVHITPLGHFEADRLEALEARARAEAEAKIAEATAE